MLCAFSIIMKILFPTTAMGKQLLAFRRITQSGCSVINDYATATLYQ